MRRFLSQMSAKVHYKIAALLFVIALVTSILNAWHGIRAMTESLVTGAEAEMAQKVAATAEQIETGLALAETDLKFLRRMPPVQGVLRAVSDGGIDSWSETTTEDWARQLQVIFTSLVRVRPDYLKVRFILEDGVEIARVDQVEGQPKVPPASTRPTQIGADYLDGALQLTNEEVYATSLALARDQGVVVEPSLPVIRFAVPVFDIAQDPKGSLVIDVAATRFLDELQADADSSARVTLLVDQSGVYLSHPDPQQRFGSDLGHGRRFTMDYPELTQAVMNGETGITQANGRVFVYHPVYPVPGDSARFWGQVESVPESMVLAGANRFRNESLLIMLLSLVVVVALGAVIGYRMVGRPVSRTADVLKDIAQGEGDLTHRLDVRSHDEIGEMAKWFNTFMDNLQTMIAHLKGTAGIVASASGELSSVAIGITDGAQAQASSLEETAASLEELTATVRQNADNAEQASQLATGARDVAEKGGRVVGEAVGAMTEISASSKKIGNIISTIDEIAFQTNLLALNAAVEAARAGEQGRGFAVVAAEVRNLAGRSATAAKEIKDLIQDSLQKVDDGSKLVDKSGQTLEEIVVSVKRVTDIVAEIAAASREQFAGIDEVNRAVTSMDQTTQGNAARTEELSATAGTLAQHGRQLSALVGKFHIGEEQEHRADAVAVDEEVESVPTRALSPEPVAVGAGAALGGANGHTEKGFSDAGLDEFEDF